MSLSPDITPLTEEESSTWLELRYLCRRCTDGWIQLRGLIPECPNCGRGKFIIDGWCNYLSSAIARNRRNERRITAQWKLPSCLM